MAVSDFRKRLDEDLKKQGKKQGESNPTTTDEYDLANRFSTAKKTIAPSVSRDLYNSAENIHGELVNNIYELGGNERIKKSGMFNAADPMINEAQYYKKLYLANPQFFKQYFGEDTDWERYFTDFKEYDGDRTDYFVGMSDATVDLLKETKNIASARTGGLDTIDMTGMPRAQKQELGRMDNLSQRDTVYEKLQQNPDQEYYEHNYGEIFQGMSEKEYLDELMAYMRAQKREEKSNAEVKKWADDAQAIESSAQGSSDYVQGKQYWRSLDRGLLDSGQNVFNVDGEELTYDDYMRNVEKSFINDYLGAIKNGDDDTIVELMEIGSAFPELDRKFSVDTLYKMDPAQVDTALKYVNNDDMDGLYKFLGMIDAGVAQKAVEEWNTNAAKWADKSVGNQILGTVASFPMNLVGGFSGAMDTASEVLEDKFGFKPIGGEYANTQANAGRVMMGMSDIFRGEMGQTIADATPFLDYGNGKNFANTAFQAIASLGDSLLSSATGPLQWVTMFGQEAGRTLYEQKDMGNDNASIYAVGVGAISAAMEKIGVDSLFKGSMKKAVLGNAGEEGLTEIANVIFDKIVNGNDSEFDRLADQYHLYGYGNKAEFRAALDIALNVGEATLGGMFAGLAGGAPDAIAARSEGKNIIENEAQYDLADLAETVGVDGQAADIMRRLQAERADKTKGDKAEAEIAEKGGVTKTDAEASAREAEMTERDKAERADETKEIAEEDAAAVTAEDVSVLENAEMNARDKAERAEDGKSVSEQDAASVTAEDVNAAKAKEQAKRDRKENAGKKKGAKAVSKAEIGYLYRETMSKLDKEAQNIVSKNFSRDIRNELDLLGYDGDSKQASEAIAKFAMGEIAPETLDILENSKVARDIALSYVGKVDYRNSLYDRAYGIAQRASKDYVKPEATKAEKGAQEATQGADDRAAISAEDVLDEDIIEMIDDDIDVEIADADESTVNGRTVTIEGVASVADDGSIVYNVKDAEGNTSMAAADEVTVGRNDSTVARLAEMAKDMGKNAEAMIKNYAEGQSVVQYAKAYKAAMQYGEDGRNLDAIKGYDSLQGLNEAQIEAAYDAGRETRTKRNTMFERKNAAGITVGNADTSAINMRALKANQAATVRSISNIAKAIGFNVKFVESKANAEGRYTTENGRWDPKTLTLTLDVHAGSNSTTDTNYAMIHTAGHELTHYIKQFADGDMWNAYQEFVVGHLSKKDGAEFNLENEITSRMNAEGLARDAAIVEVIADASGEALNRISEADIQSLAETNPGLMSKIKQFFKQWIGNLKKMISTAYKGTEAKNEVARQMMDAVDEMGKRWNALLVNAAKNRAENVVSETTNAKTALQIDAETQGKIDNSEAVTADVEIKNSLRMDEQFGAEAKRVNEKNRYVSAKTLMQALEDRATIKKIFTDPDNLNKLKLPPDIEGDTFVSDSSYGGTEENTTVYIRSMAAQALMDLISQNLGRPLTVQDTLLISQEIAGLTDRPECYYCYVATDRRAYRDFLGQYLKQRNEVIEKYKAGADKNTLYDEFRGGRKDTKNMRDRYNMWLDAVDNGTALIDGNDLSSLENLFGEVDNLRNEILTAAADASGIDAGKLNIVGGNVRYSKSGKQITAITLKSLKKSRPDMAERISRYSQLTDATAYAQSASWAKKMKGYAAYNGHILEWSQKRIDDLNRHYGLRMYSFSDFSPAFILENMQMVTDAAVRGLNMLGYTKEMPFAEIFAPTGMNINISTFAYEQGDEIREDYKQGASWERAKALRKNHPNVGIVMVATSDKILEWALQQDWVDVVIPYHLVRTGTEVAKYFGYRNYTDVSADGKGLTFAEKNKGKAKKDKVTSVSPVEHRNDLISYVDALQRHGLTPRFANWLKGLDEYLAEEISPKQFREMNPNYMKLVNETRRSYADTEPVQPRFDVEAAERAIQQMIREGGYYTPVGGSMEEQFEIAGNIADKIRNRDGQINDVSLTKSDDNLYQKRDLSNLTDRDLLVSALETDLSEAERSHLSKYKEKVEQLNKDQRKLEELNTKIVELRNAGFTPRTSEELRAAETNVATLRGRIDRADAALNQIESAAMIKEVIRRNRKEASKQRAVQLREWQEKEKYRKQVETDTKRLYKWLTAPSNKGSVPEFLRKPMGDFLTQIDFSSRTKLKGAGMTNRDYDFEKALENMRVAISKLGSQQSDIEGGAETFVGYIDLPDNFAQMFDDNVQAIKKALQVGGKNAMSTPIEKMTAMQMRELSQAMRILSSSIVHINDFVSEGRGTSAKNLADTTINEMTELKARMETNKTLELLRSFDWKNTTPYYAFERLGLGGKAMFERLQNGWDKMAFNSAKVVEYAGKTFTEEEYKAWKSEIRTVNLDSGDAVQMTPTQMMSIYCLQKRQQAQGHLLGGGIRISDIDGKHGKKISQSENYVLTVEDIARIIDSLTDRQKKVADELQAFMNDQCAKWGNEISMKRFGYRQMTEMIYFPIETDANNRRSIDESKDGKTSMFRLLNMSSLKQLTPNANNAIVVNDIFNVFADHASDMAKYNALALPILDFIKWYNHVERVDVKDDSGHATGQIRTRSTQQALEHAFGKDAKSYLKTFIRDLNAEHDGGRNDHIINRLVNRAKIASVGANMRVYMLQLTSIPRAAYEINAKYLVKGAANIRPGGEKAADKVGILKWKDLGFFSTDINRNVRTMIKQDESIWDKARNAQMKPAEWGDKLTANIIYNAVKAEMADKHPEIKPGTATYDARVNERVREIIYKTQVVDSTMTRSELMRSKGHMALWTSFMSEPTLTLNMLNESIQEAIYKKRGGKLDENDLTPGKKAAKAWTIFIVSGVATTLIASVADAFRDDDEYETWLEKYFGAMINNAKDAVNIPSMIPVIAEFAEAAEMAIKGQDYMPGSLAMQGVQSLVETVNSVREYYEGKRTLPNVIFNALKTLSYETGFGMYNAVRDAVGIYNAVIANGTTLPRIQSWRDGKDKAAKAMYKAAISNDTEEFDKMAARAALYGIEPEDLEGEYNKLISNDYLEGNISADEAKRMIKMYGGKTPYQAQTALDKLDYQKEFGEKFTDVEKNYVSGKIAKADAKTALTKYGELTENEADAKILTWDYEKTTGRKYSDISNAYLRGEMKRSEIKNAMVKYGGKDSEEAETTILHLDYQIKTERPWSELMNDYHKGRFKAGQVGRFLVEYDRKSQYEAEDIVEKYDWAKLHGGSTDGYNKYITVHEAIDRGEDITDAMEALVDKYAARGKSRKDTLSAIRSSITSKYKPIYLASSEEEQARMREQLLDVYVQLGGKYSTYYKNMTKGWFED